MDAGLKLAIGAVAFVIVSNAILLGFLAGCHRRQRRVERIEGAVAVLASVIGSEVYQRFTEKAELDRELGLIYRALGLAVEQLKLIHTLPPMPVDGQADRKALNRLLATLAGDGKPMTAPRLAHDAAHAAATEIVTTHKLPPDAFEPIFASCKAACEAALALAKEDANATA